MTTETLERILQQLSTLTSQRRLYLNDENKSDSEVIKLLQADIAILEFSAKHLGKMVLQLLSEKVEANVKLEAVSDILEKLRGM